MKKTVYYTYLGTNGTITSPVFLKDAYSVKKYCLEAEKGKVLTKDDGVTTVKTVTVPEDELDSWKEISAKASSK